MSILLEAHQGVANEYPSNTLAAFKAAKELGYSMIELDTKFTKDNKCVILHDQTINRTGRNPDGSKIENEIKISDITLEEARTYDFGISTGEKFAGEKIPTLEEVLDFAKNAQIPLKFDNVLWWSHTEEQREILFNKIEESGADCGITCMEVAQTAEVMKRLPNAAVHFDGTVTEDKLNELAKIVPAEQLFVWMRFDNARTSWNKTPPADEHYATLIKKCGRLGVWLLTTKEEAARAEELGAYIAETDGSLRP